MQIRKATILDASEIAKLLLSAMDDLFCIFLNISDSNQSLQVLTHFTEMENNQYSYQNCHVATVDDKVVAAVNMFDGSELHRLREPFINYVRQHFNQNFNPENETAAGELYIDSLGVNKMYRGKGFAKSLLAFIISSNENRNKIGLLVDPDNIAALSLYQKLNFKKVGEKFLAGKKLFHLQNSGDV